MAPPVLGQGELCDLPQLAAAQLRLRVESRQVQVGQDQLPGPSLQRKAGHQQVVALPAPSSGQLQALHPARRPRGKNGQADGDPREGQGHVRGPGPPAPRQAPLEGGQQVHPAIHHRGASGLLEQEHIGLGPRQAVGDPAGVPQHLAPRRRDQTPAPVRVELRLLPQPAESQVPAQDFDLPRRLPGRQVRGPPSGRARRRGLQPWRGAGTGQQEEKRKTEADRRRGAAHGTVTIQRLAASGKARIVGG
jgi:hypothetical protein